MFPQVGISRPRSFPLKLTFLHATIAYLINSPSYLQSFLLGILQNILIWMFKGTFIECFFKCWWNYVELQALQWCSKHIWYEYQSQTCANIYILTIFRRISHLLGEPLARIILCDDKTSKSGSNMLKADIDQALPAKLRRLGCYGKMAGKKGGLVPSPSEDSVV